MTFSELKHRYDMASFLQAQAEGRVVSWWVQWLLKNGVLLVLNLIFIAPIRIAWRWTGTRSTGIVHLIEFLIVSCIYYVILYVLITMPFSSSNTQDTRSNVDSNVESSL